MNRKVLLAAVVFFVISLPLSMLLSSCTSRGGWPRFLRHGEESDAAVAKREKQELLEQQIKSGHPPMGTNTPSIKFYSPSFEYNGQAVPFRITNSDRTVSIFDHANYGDTNKIWEYVYGDPAHGGAILEIRKTR